MRPVEFEGQTTLLHPPDSEQFNQPGRPVCGILPIREEVVGGVSVAFSCWRPSEEELALLAVGGCVVVGVGGVAGGAGHPPLMVYASGVVLKP
jgi:hypothetical protein